MHTDVADPAQVDEMVRQTVARFSTLHILVNNAGMLGPVEPLWETDIASWVQTIHVNLIGTYLCCRAVLPVMLQQNHGKIINVTSGARVRGSAAFVRRHQAAYFASKAAITQLTELLFHQLHGQNIQVNAMSPGGSTRMLEELLDRAQHINDTELFALTQQVIAADARERSAALAVFLAADASSTLSGRVISYADDFPNLPSRIPSIMASDAYTLRRVEWE
jgi:3-oxoacyl-[acyl-carrier protein] reductase